MTWWAWLLLAVNLCGYIVAFRWTSYAIAWDGFNSYHPQGQRGPGGDDVMMGLLVGAVLSVPWPVVVLYHLGGSQRFGGLLMSPPPREKRKELERRIAELERDTGMR